MASTREFKHPVTGAVGEYTDAFARRYGLVPVEETEAPAPQEAPDEDEVTAPDVDAELPPVPAEPAQRGARKAGK